MTATPYGFTLAACAEMVFQEKPFVERVQTIHDLGFAVEIWDWTTKDLDALADTGARFTSMTGYVKGGLTDPAGADDLLRSAEQSIAAAHRLGSPNLNLHGTGLDPVGLPVDPVHQVTGAMWLSAENTLRRIAELGRSEGVVFTLENLNTDVDHPGTPFARAADTHALVQAVDSAHLRMNLDLYHAQIGEGNLIELIRRTHRPRRRGSGGRRPRPLRTRHRRDQLPRHRKGPAHRWLHRRGRTRGVGLGRQPRGSRSFSQRLHAHDLPRLAPVRGPLRGTGLAASSRLPPVITQSITYSAVIM